MKNQKKQIKALAILTFAVLFGAVAAQAQTLDRPIGLALLADGRSRHGETVVAASPLFGLEVPATIGSPVFFDPQGERLHG